MDQHPYYQLVAVCLAVTTGAVLLILTLLGLLLWTRWRAAVESRLLVRAAVTEAHALGDDLTARRHQGGQSA
jgi:hypothetical protein